MWLSIPVGIVGMLLEHAHPWFAYLIVAAGVGVLAPLVMCGLWALSEASTPHRSGLP